MRTIFSIVLLFFALTATAQKATKLTIIDNASREPLANTTVKVIGSNKTLVSSSAGEINIELQGNAQLEVSTVGYTTQTFTVDQHSRVLALSQAGNTMEAVVVTANRTAQKRSEAPVAIASISKQTIEDTKAQRLDALLNKVSGVFMVNLGNEQHEMSIRQPMTTKSLFLYMEDGIPIRTTGVYNHNALLEMNLPAAKSIEVIKGPSSALYGSEAIGGAVNIITQSAPAFTSGQLSIQANDKGYKRTDAQFGTTMGKLGVIVSGYYADKRNGPIEFSDFNKKAITLRTDYRASDKTSWANTLALVDYDSDMSGSIDSLKLAQKNYTSQQTFTYRKVYALRYKSMLSRQWNDHSNTSVALLYRDNSVKQNPSYSIASTSNPLKFRGQINENTFKTYALFVNHTQQLNWLQSKVIAGASLDFSPQTYYAKFIAINKDAASGKYTSYTTPVPDSFLSKYKTGIINLASYINYEMVPVKNLKLVAALRYDAFQYYFINNLPASTSVSTGSTINSFSRLTPKLGFTYNYRGIGLYGNYSQGYVPPAVNRIVQQCESCSLPPAPNFYQL